MKEYDKINTLFARDDRHQIIEGEWSLPVFAYLANTAWRWTEKVDGTNVRVQWDGVSRRFSGKTDNSQIPVTLLHYLEDVLPLSRLAGPFSYDGVRVCLYGEGFGKGIQKGGAGYNPDGVGFVLFDVKVGDWWLERHNVEDVAAKLGLPVVPVVGVGTLADAVEFARDGYASHWNGVPAEGLVVRPSVELRLRDGGRVIGKIKHRDFARVR